MSRLPLSLKITKGSYKDSLLEPYVLLFSQKVDASIIVTMVQLLEDLDQLLAHHFCSICASTFL